MTTPPNPPQDQSPWSPPPAGAPAATGAPMAPPLPPFPGGQPAPSNGLGTTALVLGIVGLVFAIIPVTFWLGGFLGLLSLIFGIVGLGRTKKGLATNKGAAVTGVVLGVLSMVVALVWTALIAFAVKEAGGEINKAIEESRKEAAEAAAGDTAADADPLALGETQAYEDGVTVTVAKPQAYQPDQFAVGHAKGNKAFKVKVTIVNGGKKALDIGTALPEAVDAKGTKAEMVFDGKNSTGPFTGKVLPGKQATGDFVFSLPAAAAGSMQITLGPNVLEYDDAIWTGPTK
ncbi:DUF4190 domain-containing protein [Streptomyces sp. NPDC001941]|uniref:DUF4190 domain-containing protein n=1 Tax=Streptomyces sp. NPDC001941 TaxID=3154659 RepID=UPI003328B489